MITVTDSAKKQALRLMEDDNKEGYFIRVGVEGGGCSGLMYQLTFDNENKEGDKEFFDNDIKVVVDKKSFLYLIGTILDYSGGLNGKGFIFKNRKIPEFIPSFMVRQAKHAYIYKAKLLHIEQSPNHTACCRGITG